MSVVNSPAIKLICAHFLLKIHLHAGLYDKPECNFFRQQKKNSEQSEREREASSGSAGEGGDVSPYFKFCLNKTRGICQKMPVRFYIL